MTSPLIDLVVTPKTSEDRDRLALGLEKIGAQWGQLDVRHVVGTDRVVLGTWSETHLERIGDRLKREFEVEAYTGPLSVVYLETVTRSAVGSARIARSVAGRGEYAHVSLHVHPGAPGSGFRFEDQTLGRVVPTHFLASIDRGITEALRRGIVGGYQVVDVRAALHDGSCHDTDSTDAAFAEAAATAFTDAAARAEPCVLEPIMDVVVRTNERRARAVLDVLRNRRAQIQEHGHEDDVHVVAARAPLSRLFGLEGEVRLETRGASSCSIEFACYERVVDGPGEEDDVAGAGVPRRPLPSPRHAAASVPEPASGDEAS